MWVESKVPWGLWLGAGTEPLMGCGAQTPEAILNLKGSRY